MHEKLSDTRHRATHVVTRPISRAELKIACIVTLLADYLSGVYSQFCRTVSRNASPPAWYPEHRETGLRRPRASVASRWLLTTLTRSILGSCSLRDVTPPRQMLMLASLDVAPILIQYPQCSSSPPLYILQWVVHRGSQSELLQASRPTMRMVSNQMAPIATDRPGDHSKEVLKINIVLHACLLYAVNRDLVRPQEVKCRVLKFSNITFDGVY